MPLVFVKTSELLEAKPQSVSSATQCLLMQLCLEKSSGKMDIRGMTPLDVSDLQPKYAVQDLSAFSKDFLI